MPTAAFCEESPFVEEFRAFAREQAGANLSRGRVLFYGSSTIRLWESLEEDFAGIEVINRGFGGSTLEECVAEMHWLVEPLEPRALVFYAGDNDLEHGAEPARLEAALREFLRRVEARFGALPLAFIAIKPSPARFWNIAKIRLANDLLRATCAERPWVSFLDICPLMLHADGTPRADLYTADGLHLNAAGYQAWTPVVRGWLENRELQS